MADSSSSCARRALEHARVELAEQLELALLQGRATVPGGTMLATGGSPAWKTDPWNAAGRKPLLKLSSPPGGIRPPLRTTKPGRSLHSLPSP